MSPPPDTQAGALLEELAGYGLLPDCRQPKVTRWTQDIARCGECAGCASLLLARGIIDRHLRMAARDVSLSVALSLAALVVDVPTLALVLWLCWRLGGGRARRKHEAVARVQRCRVKRNR